MNVKTQTYVSLEEATRRLQEILGMPTLTKRTVVKWCKLDMLKAKKTLPTQQGRVLVLESSIRTLPNRLPTVA